MNGYYSATVEDKQMKLLYLMIFIISAFAMTACSQPASDENKEHFLSDQQRALESAQDVNKVILDAEQKKRQQIEDMQR